MAALMLTSYTEFFIQFIRELNFWWGRASKMEILQTTGFKSIFQRF